MDRVIVMSTSGFWILLLWSLEIAFMVKTILRSTGVLRNKNLRPSSYMVSEFILLPYWKINVTHCNKTKEEKNIYFLVVFHFLNNEYHYCSSFYYYYFFRLLDSQLCVILWRGVVCHVCPPNVSSRRRVSTTNHAHMAFVWSCQTSLVWIFQVQFRVSEKPYSLAGKLE